MKRSLKIMASALAFACAAFSQNAAFAQSASDAAAAYPSRPISLVVPYPPGGTSDIVGRQLAQLLRAELGGATIVVENKAGAATAIGATHVARAAKDGYTLLLSAGTTFTTNPHMNDKLQYRLTDFEPVALVTTVPFAFVVKKDFPARDIREYAAYAKANPGKVVNATNGQGSMVHLLGELVAQGLDVKLNHVHYKGAAPAMADMLAGIVDSNVEALPNAVPNVNSGGYRALAVLSAERQPLLPNVPTFRELGFPSVVGDTWYAVFAPAGTPKPVVDKLSAALRKTVQSPAFVEAMRKNGNEARWSTPAELGEFTAQQSRMWGDLIRKMNIRAE